LTNLSWSAVALKAVKEYPLIIKNGKMAKKELKGVGE
jgi:hypothetical protein